MLSWWVLNASTSVLTRRGRFQIQEEGYVSNEENAMLL